MACSDSTIRALCPKCAICCNGVLFRDVELQARDDPRRLASLGLTILSRPLQSRSKSGRAGKPAGRLRKFIQPCTALKGDRCRLYQQRPERCRDFDCALLKAVAADDVSVESALQVIADVRRKADTVRRLLRQLGDCDEHLPLARRSHRMRRRLERRLVDASVAGRFSELTLAVHDLHLLLREQFYPGDRA